MHILEMRKGRLLVGQEQAIEAARKAIAKASKVVIYAHGGLVGASQAKHTARELSTAHEAAGAVSLFPVWHTDVGTTINAAFEDIGKDKAFHRLVRRLSQLAISLWAPGGKSESGHVELPFGEKVLQEDDDEEFVKTLDESCEQILPDGPHPMTENERKWVLEQLENDIPLQQAEKDIVDGRVDSMDAQPTQEIVENARDKAAATIILATKGAKILAKVANRFVRGSHHGVYDTVAQETLRELYVDSVGQILWNEMKDSAEDAFGGEPDCGGSVLLSMLESAWHDGLEVLLVGHSAGSIFHSHLLMAADQRLDQNFRFGMVLQAPAVSFRFLHARRQIFSRLAGLRIFNLSDDRESSYWEIPVLSRGSLLYIVAGLLEEEVDEPLLGMQRYFSDAFNSVDTIREIRKCLGADPVWAVANYADGFRTSANKHGGFSLDPATLASVQYIIQRGF